MLPTLLSFFLDSSSFSTWFLAGLRLIWYSEDYVFCLSLLSFLSCFILIMSLHYFWELNPVRVYRLFPFVFSSLSGFLSFSPFSTEKVDSVLGACLSTFEGLKWLCSGTSRLWKWDWMKSFSWSSRFFLRSPFLCVFLLLDLRYIFLTFIYSGLCWMGEGGFNFSMATLGISKHWAFCWCLSRCLNIFSSSNRLIKIFSLYTNPYQHLWSSINSDLSKYQITTLNFNYSETVLEANLKFYCFQI